MLQLLLVQETHKRTGAQKYVNVVLQQLQKRAGNGSQYRTISSSFLIPQYLPRTGCCFMFRLGLWNLQHIVYIKEFQTILCVLPLCHADHFTDHFNQSIPNFGLALTSFDGQQYKLPYYLEV